MPSSTPTCGTTAGPGGGGESRPATRATRSEARLGFYLIAPTLATLAVVIGYPIVQALYRSFFDDPIADVPRFIGFGNYAEALSSHEWWAALRVTVFFTVVSVAQEVVIGFAMALVMHHAFRGRALVRASVLVPWAIPTAVGAVLWSWMLQPTGIINHLLGTGILWTGSEWPAKFAIIIADTWKTAPFVALLLLAGLQTIPQELYEAAKVDGAGAWQRFRHITLPLVTPALLVAVLFRVLDVLRIYDLPAILTGGANDTTTLSILVVRASVSNLQPGYGSALSTLVFFFIFFVALLLVKLFGADVVQRQQRSGKN